MAEAHDETACWNVDHGGNRGCEWEGNAIGERGACKHDDATERSRETFNVSFHKITIISAASTHTFVFCLKKNGSPGANTHAGRFMIEGGVQMR